MPSPVAGWPSEIARETPGDHASELVHWRRADRPSPTAQRKPLSAQPEAMEDEQKKYIKKSFAVASTVQTLAEPLDWMNNPRPQEWLLNGKRIDFDWS